MASFISSGASQLSKLQSFHPRETVADILQVFTGIDFEVKERQEQLDDLGQCCERLAAALHEGSKHWDSETLRASGAAAQRTLEKVLQEAKGWKSRWYVSHLANDAAIDKDIDSWNRSIERAMAEYTMCLVQESSLGRQSMSILTEDAASIQRVKTWAGSKDPRAQAGVEQLMGRAYEELHSPTTTLTEEQRETLTRNLRDILPNGAIPEFARLKGQLTLVSQTPIVNHGSDVFQETLTVVVGGQARTTLVAVKRLRDPNPNETRLRRFLYEGTLWRLLVHPNIVPFFGIHEMQDARLELVSLWLENRDAITYIHAHPDRNRRQIVKGAAHGLAYLHRCNVVHGSIRGANILISDSGEAMLSDFGLAAASSSDGEVITAGMSTSATVTTARWMAPEVATSSTPVPILPSDIFSFASTILEIMTGEKPLSKIRNVYMIVSMLSSGRFRVDQPTEPEVKRRGLTDGVWALMLEMWRETPEKRPTMGEVEKRLAQLL